MCVHYVLNAVNVSVIATAKDATMLIFVTPHQFVEGICRKLQGKVREDAKAISLIKGMEV